MKKKNTSGILCASQIGDEWTDDHVLCCIAELDFNDGKTQEVEFLWCGWPLIAALKYSSDSEEALADVQKIYNMKYED